jgi:hypothetical protein
MSAKESMMRRRTFIGAAGALLTLPRGPLVAAPAAYPNIAALRDQHRANGIIRPNRTYRTMEWECHTPPEGNFDIDVEK